MIQSMIEPRVLSVLKDNDGPSLGNQLLENDFSFELTPIAGVEGAKGSFEATCREPWLQISRVEKSVKPGALVEISYRAGLMDEVTRPVLRFWTGGETFHDAILPAASLGRGIWRGRLPEQLKAIWVSPTRTPGPFSFEIERIRPLTLLERLRSYLSEPKRAFFAISASSVGLREESILNFRWMLGQAETQDYAGWKGAHAVAAGDIGSSTASSVVIVLRATDETAVRASFESLARQSHRNWRLAVVDSSASSMPSMALPNDSRVSHVDHVRDANINDADFALFLISGDELESFALDCLLREFQRRPELSIVYADHAQKVCGGELAPVLKPDWSPVRQAHAPYVGRAVMIASSQLDQNAVSVLETRASPENWIDDLLVNADESAVGRVARPLFILDREIAISPRKTRSSAKRGVRIDIIIPSRDRSYLIEPCIRSIFTRTAYPDFQVVIVDNGSLEPATHQLYEALKAEFSKLSIVAAPGPFNFSKLCNLGAGAQGGEFLVFLNNDTEVLQADWLDHLLEMAHLPEVGAVGANLLYPDGLLQHAGVVLGFGGVAGHFEEGAAADCRGWLGALQEPREVSAVTGACMMIERHKFETVGGFDEVNLPVELNDIDLCLRLSESGWRTLCDGRTRLRHHCSASRGGRKLRLQRVYEKERTYFKKRWLHLIRDDPFFNPNLSLYRHQPRWG